MSTTLRFTTADLEALPDRLDGGRYEIVDGELYVTTQPNWRHQFASGRVFAALDTWSAQTGAGVANLAPGIIFGGDDNVAPDVVWVSRRRLAGVLGADGKLHAAPDLVVEVLSPGAENARRDEDVKLKLYSRRGVREYWIVDWETRQVAVYRRDQGALHLVTTLHEADTLESPLLPGFACPVSSLFMDLPEVEN